MDKDEVKKLFNKENMTKGKLRRILISEFNLSEEEITTLLKEFDNFTLIK